jgi:hypothetical protein
LHMLIIVFVVLAILGQVFAKLYADFSVPFCLNTAELRAFERARSVSSFSLTFRYFQSNYFNIPQGILVS